MKQIKRFFQTLTAVCCTAFVLGAMQISASAATKEQDGIEASLSADLTENTSISAQLTLSNTNRFDLKNIGISYNVPDGYSIGNEQSVIALLKSGESVSLDVEYYSISESAETTEASATTVQTSRTTALSSSSADPQSSTTSISSSSTAATTLGNTNSPKTGDGFPAVILTCAVLASGAAAAVCIRKKGGKRFLSLILCGTLCAPALVELRELRSDALEEYEIRSFTFTEVVENGSEQIRINVTITYNYPTGEFETENISFDLGDTLYDSYADTYYVFDKLNMLSGLIRDDDRIASVSYSITDCNDKELMGGTLEPSDKWEIENVGLIVGENNVSITVEYKDETVDRSTVTINNLCEENMEPLNVDKGDNDEDGVLNFIEELYHTDPERSDSDGDRMSDYYEMAIIGTDPTEPDSDKDGITDDNEDNDEDQLSNYEEIYIYETDPITADSDGDCLNDFAELNEHETDPNNEDTDGDDSDDYWELQNDFDPRTFDEELKQANDEAKAEAEAADEAEQLVMDDGTTITFVSDDDFFDETTPGYMDVKPFDIDLGENSSSEIIIPIDTDSLAPDDEPVIYFIDDKSNQIREIETDTSKAGTVRAKVYQSGRYILLNHREVADVWANDFDAADEDRGDIDVVFVIDRSASMGENDPENIRKKVVKDFIAGLRRDDRAAVVQFTAVAETVMPLTNDIEALVNAVNSIENSDGGGCAGKDKNPGTNGAAGIRNALNELKSSDADHKYIVFLTDGADTTTQEGDGYPVLEAEARSNGVVIYTVGLVGDGEVNIDQLKEIASETGGNYYLASSENLPENPPEMIDDIDELPSLQEVFSELELQTINREYDGNDDKLSDFYTKLLCEGNVTSSKGVGVFGAATYQQVYDAGSDYDKDGLANGEEVVIMKSPTGFCAKLISYPFLTDSDHDTLSDYDEKKVYGTNPMKTNRFVNIGQDEIDWIVNNDSFVANRYIELYEFNIIGLLEKGSVNIGNTFFGTTYDACAVYQNALVDFLVEIDKDWQARNEIHRECSAMMNVTNSICDELVAEAKETMAAEMPEKEKMFTLENIWNVLCDIYDAGGTGLSAVIGRRGANGLDEETLVTFIEELSEEIDRTSEIQLSYAENNPVPSDQPNKYIEAIRERFNRAVRGRTKADHDLVVTERLNKFNNVYEKVSWVFTLGSIAGSEWETYQEYQKMMASADTVNQNVYVLDAIINSDCNPTLKRAAMGLKCRLVESYESEMNDLYQFLADNSYLIKGWSSFAEIGHVFIGKMGEVGAAIELVRTVGNLAFNMNDVAEESTKLYAIAKTSNILGDRYKAFLDNGNAVIANGNMVFYTNSGDEGVDHLYELLHARVAAELQMKEKNKAYSFLTQWLSTKVLYRTDECDANIAECQRILKTI